MQARIEELKKCFNDMDVNNDGVLTLKEVLEPWNILNCFDEIGVKLLYPYIIFFTFSIRLIFYFPLF